MTGSYWVILLLWYSSVISGCITNDTHPVGRIPFRLINNTIFIKLTIGDSDSLNFIFDTGASVTLIGKNVGIDLGLTNGIDVNNTGAAGVSKFTSFTNNKIILGDVNLTNVTLIEDHSKLRTSIHGEDLDGIIGYDILSRYVVSINYDEQHLLLYEFQKFKPHKGSQIILFDPSINIPKIKLSFILGGKTMEGFFFVDTGASGSLFLNTPFVDRHELIDRINHYYEVETSLGSSATQTKLLITRGDQVSLVGVDFVNIPIVISRATDGVLGSSIVDGILGNDILKRFNMTIDYSNDKMYLVKNGNLSDRFQLNCSGLILDFRGTERRIFVKDLIEGSPAAESNIQVGDELLKLGGEKIKLMNQSRLEAILNSCGEEISVQFSRGKEIIEEVLALREMI